MSPGRSAFGQSLCSAFLTASAAWCSARLYQMRYFALTCNRCASMASPRHLDQQIMSPVAFCLGQGSDLG